MQQQFNSSNRPSRPSSNRKILDIVEWRPTRFTLDDLTIEQAALIAQSASKKITVTWSDPASRYVEITSKGWVGTIRCGPDLALRITPRFPIERLFQLLRWAKYKTTTDSDTVPIGVAADADEWLARRFVELLQRIIAGGLHKSYIRKAARGQVARGRLLMADTARLQGKGSVDIAYEDYVLTPDVFENRSVLWTAHVLLSRTSPSENIRAPIATLYSTMSRWVTLRPIRPRDFDQLRYDSRTERYRDLHELCRLILEGSTPEHGLGTTEFDAFGVDTSTLFQLGVSKALTGLRPMYRSKPQHVIELAENLEFRIDNALMLAGGTSAEVVLDAKYKDPFGLDTADVQQIVAYATAAGTRFAFLVYPTPAGLIEPITVGDVNLAFVSLDLSKPVEESAQALRERVLAKIAEWGGTSASQGDGLAITA